ncbi:MAG: Asp-tRNA(Asn)/Glu-tRNA(Gln) amidotransferase subunit GatA [Bacteroidota bacterium]
MMSSIDSHTRSLKTIQKALDEGLLSLVQLVDYYLEQIEKTQSFNIYVEVFTAAARKRAIVLSRKPVDQRGRLFGAIVSIKDVLCLEGHTVTAGSKMLDGFSSLYTATALQRLLDEDAIFIGRTNCDEFAMGSTNETSFYGPTKNGQDPDKVPGGSSGGSAVSVQLNTCLLAVGSDTGGSVRQPAALCGVYGLKPTYGRVSRHGLIAYASSFDQIGLLGNDLADIALALEIMAGSDQYDATLSERVVPSYVSQLEQSDVQRIGYFPATLNHPSLEDPIKATVEKALEKAANNGIEIVECDFPWLDYLVPAYYILTTAEASSNLSRFDGVRYGHRSAQAANVDEVIRRSRTEGFGEEVKKRIMLGTFVLSSGYYDAYYDKALRVRRLLVETMNQLFTDVDVLLMPTTTRTAWPLGESLQDPVEMYLSDIYTVLSNLTGTPGLTIPVKSRKNPTLSVGLQILGPKFSEARLMSFGQQLGKILG